MIASARACRRFGAEESPLDVVLIALRLEDVEGVELPIERLEHVHTVAELTALLRATIMDDIRSRRSGRDDVDGRTRVRDRAVDARALDRPYSVVWRNEDDAERA
jgi:hypothetical protein